ncbi:MAG TPA: hypothetical protein VNP36_09460, partial [Burkholderiales bacterium]|nr:hypothetical protein [Burkholderiales bacterium]
MRTITESTTRLEGTSGAAAAAIGVQQHYIDRSEEDLERRLAARFDPTRKRGRLDAQMSGEGMDSAENLARALQRSGMDRGSRRRRAAAIG